MRTGHRTKIHRGQIHAGPNTNAEIHSVRSLMSSRSSPGIIVHQQNTGEARGDEIMQIPTHIRSLFNRNNNKNIKFHGLFTSKNPKLAGSKATPSAEIPWNATYSRLPRSPGATTAGGGVSWGLLKRRFHCDEFEVR